MDSLSIFALIVAIPMGVMANLLTPPVQNWWATTSVKRKQRRIAKLEAELKQLKGETEEPPVTPPLLQSSSRRLSKQPVLEYSYFQMVGMATLGQQLGFNTPSAHAMFIRNSEQRFETVAHNLKASVILKAVEGKEARIEDAAWFKNASANLPGACYHQNVNIGMLENAGVVCTYRDADCKFYTALYCDETRVKSGVPLANGQWDVEIHVDGDNVAENYKFRMQLLPTGNIRFIPSDNSPVQSK
jgi:hypothetical protein